MLSGRRSAAAAAAAEIAKKISSFKFKFKFDAHRSAMVRTKQTQTIHNVINSKKFYAEMFFDARLPTDCFASRIPSTDNTDEARRQATA